jgi:flagellar hook-associated protein 3 FlgL
MLTSSSSMASLVSQAGALSDQQAEISRELSSGTRLTRLSNGPLAAAATVRLSSGIAQAAATASAIQSVQARMQAADSALGAVVTQLTSAIAVVVGAANGTENAADLQAAAGQLSGIHATVLNLANSSYNGDYLFSGTSSSVPFVEDSSTGAVSYQGDSAAMSFAVGGQSVQTSASGTALFGTGTRSAFATLQGVISTMTGGGTPTADQVASLRSSLQTVIDGRSALATSQSRIQAANTMISTQQTNLQAEQTSVAASDPVALAMQLSAAETQRSALLSSLAMIGKSSLFDYLSS